MKPQADKNSPSDQHPRTEKASKENPTHKQVNLASMANSLLAEIKQLKMQNQFLEASNDRVTSYLARVQADRDVFRKESARLLERCARLEATIEEQTKAQQKKPFISSLIEALSTITKFKLSARMGKSLNASKKKLTLSELHYRLVLILDKLKQHVTKVQRRTQDKVNKSLQQRRLAKAKIKREKAKEKQMQLFRQTKRPQVRRTTNKLSQVEKEFFDYKTAQ